MEARAATHPTDQTLNSYGLGKLDDSSAEVVNKHLEECPTCRKRVAEMSADSFLGRIRDAQKSASQAMFSQSQPGETRSRAGTNAPPPVSTLPPGLAEHPGYEILRELGRGGMGVVYLAQNTLMGRKEVLKVVSGQLIDRQGVRERFLREIRSAAMLHHTNIVAAFSALAVGESIVFAMEYVEGYDLAQLVKGQGPLPVTHSCNFVHQAALDLQYAHQKGMVHRDIKPSNLILAREGKKPVVKVLDFGLAKVTRVGQTDSGLTREGQMLGTPDYIAPEQIRDAQSADIRADIYSLGCTLYFLLAGRPPFQADSLYDIYQAHISREADSLNLIRPEVPAELAALVAKMMAKEPDRRFQTPGEVAQALTPFFKRANAAYKSLKPEVSHAGQADTGRETGGTTSEPTQHATDAGQTIARSKTPAGPSAANSRWESLIDFREEGPEGVPPLAPRPAGRPPRKWWPVALVASVFGLIVLGVIITIRDPFGKKIAEMVVPKDSTITVEPSLGEATGKVGGADAARDKPRSPAEPERASEVRPPLVRSPDVALETLSPAKATTGFGTIYMNKNFDGGPIRLGGKTYASGVGVHANAELVYDLRPEYDRFVGRVGIDDSMKEAGSIIVRVFADAQLLKESPVLNGGTAPWDASVELPKDAAGRASGRLRLVVDATGDGHDADVTDWVDAGVVVNPRLVPPERVGDSPASLPRPDVALETLTPVNSKFDWRDFQFNKTAEGKVIALGGKTYARGVGVHANAELVYDLRPEYDRFVGRVGIDDSMKEASSIIVRVYVDEKLLGASPVLNAGTVPWKVNVELPKDAAGRASGRLRLVVDATGDGHDADMTDWVDAGFVFKPRLVRATGGTGGPSTATIAPRPQAPVGEPSVPTTVLSGSWRVDREELIQASKDEKAMSTVLFGHPDWTDYDFTFEMKSDQGTGAANVFYRGSQRGKEALVFVIPSKPDPCWVEIWQDEGGEGGGEPEGPARFRFVKGTWIPVRVRVRGNRSVCSVFENGREVVAIRVGTGKHSKGQVGLSTFGSSYRFRNIQVTAPDGTTLWKGVPDLPN